MQTLAKEQTGETEKGATAKKVPNEYKESYSSLFSSALTI